MSWLVDVVGPGQRRCRVEATLAAPRSGRGSRVGHAGSNKLKRSSLLGALIPVVHRDRLGETGQTRAVGEAHGTPVAPGRLVNSPHGHWQTPDNDRRIQGLSALDPLGPGQIVGGYRILSRVAAGGTAEVFQAQELTSGRVVAFKTALPNLRANAHLAKRCLREARIAMRLAHENIVKVYDAGEHRGVPFMVMEWLAGEDLRSHLVQRGSLEGTEAVRLLLPVFDAVAYGHAMGVIHRDIKLDNVVLHRELLPDGSVRTVPKLVDFGVSRLVGATALTLDARSSLLGTPQYMAPEQARGEAEPGPAVDQHGLAVALYVLLCGHFPRAGGNLSQLVMRVALEGFVPLRARAPSLDPELAAIVERGMALEPAGRFASVDDFARALRQWVSRSEQSSEVECSDTLLDISTVGLRGVGGEGEWHLEAPHPQTREQTLALTQHSARPAEATLASPELVSRDAPDSAPESSLSAPGSLLQVRAARWRELVWLLVAGLLGALVVASLALSVL